MHKGEKRCETRTFPQKCLAYSTHFRIFHLHRHAQRTRNTRKTSETIILNNLLERFGTYQKGLLEREKIASRKSAKEDRSDLRTNTQTQSSSLQHRFFSGSVGYLIIIHQTFLSCSQLSARYSLLIIYQYTKEVSST